MSDPAKKQKDAKFEKQENAALERIEELDEADKLHTLMLNARRMGSEKVAEAAFRKRIEVLAGDDHDSAVAMDFWRSIHTLEAALTEERGKTIRLTRTRQKLTRAGAVKTLADLAVAPKPSEGFALLMDRDLSDLTAESVVLRHPEEFDEKTRDAAAARLAEYTTGTTEGTTNG